MKFTDVQAAGRIRDLMRKIAKGEIDLAHPHDVFGHVSDIDEIAGTVRVAVPGSTDEASASYGFGDAPNIGDPVRVTGRAGSRYVVGTGNATNTPEDPDGLSISELDPAGALTGVELVAVVQGGVTVRTTTQDIADLATGGGASGFPVGPYDDGSATYSISIPTPQELLIKTVLDADTSQFVTEGQIVTSGGTSWFAEAAGTGGYCALTIRSDSFVLTQNSNAIFFQIHYGDPNGVIAGSPGDISFDASTPAIWINTAYPTTWTKVGP